MLTQLQINSSNPNSVAVQTDGKIVVAATGDKGLTLARYNSDGSPDNTFSVADNLTKSDSSYIAARTLAIQGDGKIVLGGYWANSKSIKDFVVARFNINGSRDNTFNKSGIQSTDFRTYDDYINAVAIQSDGKIVAAGYASNGLNNAFAIARYNTDGSADNTFDTDGKKMNFIGSADVYAVSLAIQSNGKLVAAGYNQSAATTNIAITKYNTDGSFDNTFNRGGTSIVYFKQKNTVFTSSVVQKDGKIAAAGYAWNGTNYDNIAVRYNTNGSADTSFSSDGMLITGTSPNPYTSKIALQSDGKIVVAAGGLLTRYNTNGSLDNTFGTNGKQTAGFGISVLKLQIDGRIVIAGGITIARYTANGSLDNSFNGNGILSTYYLVKDLAFQSDGKIVVGEDSNEDDVYILVRYNVDGSADVAFSGQDPHWGGDEADQGDYFTSHISSVSIQKDGKIIAAGYGGYSDRYSLDYNTLVARYNPDGSLDKTFSEDGKDIPLGYSKSSLVALQDDGKIIVASDLYENLEYGYGYYNDVPSGFGIVRYNNNGNPDSSFGTNGRIFSQQDEVIRMRSIVIANNKLYVAGNGEVRPVGKYGIHIVTNFGFLARFQLADNKLPTVKITSPANNAVYAAPATITVNATASDSDGTIHSVKFYNGTTYLKSIFISPYTYTISNLPAGTYTLTAKATDNTGAETISAPVKVIVNKAPVVSITSPSDNAAFTAPATITINATASDPDGTIHSVKFYNGTTYLKSIFTSPYTYTISNLPAGTYSLTAKATDNNGAQTISAAVIVSVKAPNKAPTVTITSPANKATYAAPANITVNALAADADGTIHSVKFYNGTTYLKSIFTSPYTYTLSNLPAGTYSLTAKATDNDGAQTISASVTVTVSNAIIASKPVNTKTGMHGEMSVKLYPNPATNVVNININGLQQSKPATLSIISTAGNVLKTMQSNNSTTQLDVLSLVSGVYTVKIVSAEKIIYKQFVKL